MNKQFMSVMTIIVFMTVVFIYDAYSNVTKTYRTISTQVEYQQNKRIHLTQMYNAARERSLTLLEMMSETDPFELDAHFQKLGSQARRFLSAREQLFSQPLTDAERALLKEQNSLTRINAPLQDQVAQLLVDDQRQEALALLFDRAIPGQNKVLNRIAQIIELESGASQKMVGTVNQNLEDSGVRFGMIIGVFVTTVLLVFLYIFRTSRKEKRLLSANLKMQQAVSDQLRLSQEKLSQYTNALSTFTVMLTPDGVVELINDAAVLSVSEDTKSFLGRYFYDCFWWGYSQEVQTQLKKDIYRCSHGEQIDREVKILVDGGEFMVIRFILTPIKDASNQVIYLVAEGQDITERKKIAEKISYQASHDSLTGLINRYEFEHRLSLLLQRAEDGQLHYVFYLDLDQFKIINDTCGHSAGDELLRQVPALIQPHIRQSDVLARLGGDEFAIILENSDLSIAQKIATAIIRSVSDYQFFWEDKAFRIGVSIGIVEVDDSMFLPDTIMKWTDSACYAAKDQGRNTYHFYTPDDEKLIKREEEMDWISRMERALQEDQFVLYAQPIVPVDASIGEQRNYELLLRMQDDHEGLIPPGAFLPAAERYNRMMVIDYWVFSEAISLLSDHPGFLNSVGYCSINVSAQSLSSQDFLEFLLANISAQDGLAEKICIEVTETAAISNMTEAMRFISALRAIGVRFALDDFGSGLSSFGYLKTLTVDFLKVDGMFVKDIVEDPIDFAMVKSIHEVGSVMGLKTIAEFVENQAILAKLQIIGVDFAQGYGIGKPQPLSDLLKK